jgi:DNA topoisomerase-3
MTVPRVLCVAEKPAIAKAVSQHLSGGSFQTVSRLEGEFAQAWRYVY